MSTFSKGHTDDHTVQRGRIALPQWVAERHDQEDARPQMQRAARRARHLVDRARRKPLGSNGRRKDEAQVQALINQTFQIAQAAGITEDEAAALFPGLRKPGPTSA